MRLPGAAPFSRIVEEALTGTVDGADFFDMLAEDIVVDYVITVPGYPRRVVGRDAVADLYRPYGAHLMLDRCFDLAVYHDRERGVIVLEWPQKAVLSRPAQPMPTATSRYSRSRTQGDPLEGLPRPACRIRRARVASPAPVSRLARDQTARYKAPRGLSTYQPTTSSSMWATFELAPLPFAIENAETSKPAQALRAPICHPQTPAQMKTASS